MKFFRDFSTKLTESPNARAKRIGTAMNAAADLPLALGHSNHTLTSKSDWAHLNPEGQKVAKQRAVTGDFDNLAKLKKTRDELKADFVKAGKPAIPGPDRSDLYGEMQRAELRSLFRALPADK